MFPKVVQVIPEKNYSVFVYFEDGKIVHYDSRPILEKEVFRPLKDIHVFMNSCTVLNDTLAWDIQGNRDTTTCLDIDPDTLYDLPSSKDPFEMEKHSAQVDDKNLLINIYEDE